MGAQLAGRLPPRTTMSQVTDHDRCSAGSDNRQRGSSHNVTAGANPCPKRGIDEAVSLVVDELHRSPYLSSARKTFTALASIAPATRSPSALG